MALFSDKNLPIGEVIKSAFFFWQRSILYQVVYSLLFLSIFIGGFFYLMDYYDLSKDFVRISRDVSMSQSQRYVELQKVLLGNPNASYFSWAIIGIYCFLFPMNMGLFAIFRKIDTQQRVVISDLFMGYSGKNFFIYTSYFLFWLLSLNLAMSTVVLAPVWWLVTLFVAPLMFFKNIRIFEGIALTVNVFRKHFIDIIAVLIVGLVVKYIAIFSFFGIPLFFGFSNAVVYALYRSYFSSED